jgi:hypothetical protein
MVIFAYAMEVFLRKKMLALVVVSMTVLTVQAQRGGNTPWKKYRHEASVGYGVNNVFATLGERDNLGVAYVLQRSAFNGSYRYYALRHLAVRGSITHGYSRKNDKSTDYEDRLNTRLDYQCTITEFAAMAEYHIIDETTKGKKGKVRRARGGVSKGLNVGVSGFAGVGLSYFRFYGELMGEPMILKPITQPLTIPNSDRYKPVHLHIPIGMNARILINENWRVGLEAGYRIGFREYINNISGVYSVDENFLNPDTYNVDPRYFGLVTFAKERAPLADLASDSGKRNYFFAMVTLSYRLKL